MGNTGPTKASRISAVGRSQRLAPWALVAALTEGATIRTLRYGSGYVS